MDQPDGIKVSIYDQVYHLKSDAADHTSMREVAEYVDRKMRMIASKTRTVDSVRVAVLAALHIADEMMRLREEHARLQQHVQAKSLECAALLDQVLQH